ncbi:hypothetical protein pdul_cds_979 [Pandoravirus dulcis]|uniref:Uncharacterized protein n=1 Tax=Pandoravirus dulcis TaxID=1349409 RepID=A0A291AUE5_9VIRU|nr:hypothetical protein pdul_cds_979 [Pandoravirus dulcis]ATE82575.1 hypothetical protein pdul_cds_979 [Pandoravirus dulcis]
MPHCRDHQPIPSHAEHPFDQSPPPPPTETHPTDASGDDFAEWDALCATLPKGIFRTVVDGLEADD